MAVSTRESTIVNIVLVLMTAAFVVLATMYKGLKEDYVIAVAQKVVIETELDQRFDELVACEAKLPTTEAVVDPE